MRVTLALLLAAFGGAVVLASAPDTPSRRASDDGAVQKPSTTGKGSRTAAQQKLSSSLLDEIARVKNEANGRRVPREQAGVQIDGKGRARVDIRAAVTDSLRTQIDTIGGTIIASSPQYESTVAWIPILMLERLAANRAVRAIVPAAAPTLQ